MQQLKQGALMEDLDDPDYITSHKAEGVTRATAADHNPEVVRAVFKLSKPTNVIGASSKNSAWAISTQ